MVGRRNEVAIKGTTVGPRGREPRRIDGHRTCADPTCSTALSTYNTADRCWIHEEPHPYVLDGVRRKDRPVADLLAPRRAS